MFVSSTQVSKEGKVGKAQYNDVSYLLKLVSTKVIKLVSSCLRADFSR